MGILGAGGIAGAFADAAKDFKNVDLVAIGSRDPAKAAAFAAVKSLPRSYGSYADLVADPGIDAVYNALPNGLHKDWSIAAVRAGKHVLCEKPIAVTARDAEEMFEEAEKNGVKLIEGVPYRFQPQTVEVLDRVRKGDIGSIQTMTACFGFTLSDPHNVRWEPDQGGGAMWDVGSYAVNLTRAVMGKKPIRVHAAGRIHRSGVDSHCSALLVYDDGRTVPIWCSFETAFCRRASLIGSTGSIHFSYQNGIESEEGAAYEFHPTEPRSPAGAMVNPKGGFGNGFVYEADAFGDYVLGIGDCPGTTAQESVDNMATIVAVLKSLRSGRAEAV